MISYGLMKRWQVLKKFQIPPLRSKSFEGQTNFPSTKLRAGKFQIEDLINGLLENRGLKTKREIDKYLHPPPPLTLKPGDVGIDKKQLDTAIRRINVAIRKGESIVVYADYDADGITAGAILWEVLYKFGKNVMPYIPHRSEGYGLSEEGIDTVQKAYNPSLIITVDHGITAAEKIAYAKKRRIDVIVTDHHATPKKLPRCPIVHTTQLSGAGVSWFLAKELIHRYNGLTLISEEKYSDEILALCAIGTIADMLPLLGPNRSIAKYGLAALNKTSRVGLKALIADAGITLRTLGTYEVSHLLAPRLNAMGRIEHAIDALRLLCTGEVDRAEILATKLGLTNRDRQKLTEETTLHALQGVALQRRGHPLKKLIFISHESYNQGIIGLVAGKLVDEYYRPAIVVAVGETHSKASARSIAGFNIVEAIRSVAELLVDVGGHPMAAGFTVETKHLSILQSRLEQLVEEQLTDEMLTRQLKIDVEIPLEIVTTELWKKLQEFQPFGFGNPEPVFVSRNVIVADTRLVGNDGKHLKLRLQPPFAKADSFAEVATEAESGGKQFNNSSIDAIAFNLGSFYGKLKSDTPIDIAYTIDMDTWNDRKRLQLKIRDIQIL